MKLQLVKVFLSLATIKGVFGNCYSSIFSFGDSLTDSGNIYFTDPTQLCLFPPYGESYFTHPTGRCCNGRLVLDFTGEQMSLRFLIFILCPHIYTLLLMGFIYLFFVFVFFCFLLAAQTLGLPLIKPYLDVGNGSTIQEGVNFAVVGATALDASFFFERGIDNVSTNDSLSVQLGWFKKILPSLCNTSSGKFTI